MPLLTCGCSQASCECIYLYNELVVEALDSSDVTAVDRAPRYRVNKQSKSGHSNFDHGDIWRTDRSEVFTSSPKTIRATYTSSV